VLARGPEVG